MKNLYSEIIEYKGPLLSDRYNQFFNPNICHVCKRRSDGNLISCDECCLVFYCSEEHKLMHRVEHIGFCTIVSCILINKSQNERSKFVSWQEWIQTREELLRLIQDIFDCPLKPYVEQMILWCKTCLICYQQVQLRCCEKCFSVNYCNDHKEAFYMKHTIDECDRLTIMFNINIETISREIDVSFDLFSHFKWEDFLRETFQIYVNYIKKPELEMCWTAIDYILIDYVSEPLTIYNGLRKMNLLGTLKKSKYTIHIITAKSMDKIGVNAWEILLHLLPNIRMLSIVFIGPQFDFTFGKLACCSACKEMNRKLFFTSIPTLYHDYLSAPLGYEIPIIIAGFEAKFEPCTWMKFINIIQNQSVPLLLTFSNKEKAQRNIDDMQSALQNINIKPTLHCRNYFVGLAPHRDVKTGYTYKRNRYLIIYEHLYNLNTY